MVAANHAAALCERIADKLPAGNDRFLPAWSQDVGRQLGRDEHFDIERPRGARGAGRARGSRCGEALQERASASWPPRSLDPRPRCGRST